MDGLSTLHGVAPVQSWRLDTVDALWQVELKGLQRYSRLILSLGLTSPKERKSKESLHTGRKDQLKE